jgi:S-adenosylmethionine decarboxylase proenzyme
MVGIHLLLDVSDVEDKDILQYLDVGKKGLETIIEKCELTVVGEVGYQFQPYGYTYAYILSESHFTIHTYPEKKSCYIDIFCCNETFNWRRAVKCVKGIFNTNSVKVEVIAR